MTEEIVCLAADLLGKALGDRYTVEVDDDYDVGGYAIIIRSRNVEQIKAKILAKEAAQRR